KVSQKRATKRQTAVKGAALAACHLSGRIFAGKDSAALCRIQGVGSLVQFPCADSLCRSNMCRCIFSGRNKNMTHFKPAALAIAVACFHTPVVAQTPDDPAVDADFADMYEAEEIIVTANQKEYGAVL